MLVEKSLRKLVITFKEDPLRFFNERELHHVFHDGVCSMLGDDMRFCFELPTKEKYMKRTTGYLEPYRKGTSAFLDLAIVDARKTPVVGLEMNLNISNSRRSFETLDLFRTHSMNDFEKLTNTKNKVGVGYLLHFLYDDLRSTRSTDRRAMKRLKQLQERKRQYWDVLVSLSKTNTKHTELKILQAEVSVEPNENELRTRGIPKGWLSL
ncbi:MAG: hypothetical protein ACE5IJ_04210 [Thermoplasmata archaeon]